MSCAFSTHLMDTASRSQHKKRITVPSILAPQHQNVCWQKLFVIECTWACHSSVFTEQCMSCTFSTHLMDTAQEDLQTKEACTTFQLQQKPTQKKDHCPINLSTTTPGCMLTKTVCNRMHLGLSFFSFHWPPSWLKTLDLSWLQMWRLQDTPIKK